MACSAARACSKWNPSIWAPVLRFVAQVSNQIGHNVLLNVLPDLCPLLAPPGELAHGLLRLSSTTPIPRREHEHRPISARGGVREADKYTRRCSHAGFLVPLGVPNGPCSSRLPSAPQHARGGDRALSRCALPWAGQHVAHRFRFMLRTSSCRSCRGWLRPRLALGWPRLGLRRGAACRPFIGVSAAKTITGASVAGIGGWPAAR